MKMMIKKLFSSTSSLLTATVILLFIQLSTRTTTVVGGTTVVVASEEGGGGGPSTTITTQKTKNVGININNNKSKEEETTTTKKTRLKKHFKSRWSDVYVVENFLPLEVATKWRQQLKETWINTTNYMEIESSRIWKKHNHENIEEDFNKSIFVYATNNNGNYEECHGTEEDNNSKTRSLDLIKERRQVTKQAYENYGGTRFTYGKWELHPTNPLIEEMESYMSSMDTLKKVQRIIRRTGSSLIKKKQQHDDNYRKLSSKLSDLFVTYYEPGDFLSQHDDDAAGSWAFVISLTEFPSPENGESSSKWDGNKYGGTIRFQCDMTDSQDPRVNPNDIQWCEEFTPSFNTAIFIQTRVVTVVDNNNNGRLISIPGPYHEVMEVLEDATKDGYYRFGLTGWYNDANDQMSEDDEQIRNKIRARD